MHAWQFEGCHSIGRDIFLLCTLAPVTRVIPIPYGVEAIWRGVSVRKEIECLTMILRIWEKRRTDLYRSLTLLRKEARVNPNASEIIKLKVQEFCFPHFKKSTPQFLWVGRGLNLWKNQHILVHVQCFPVSASETWIFYFHGNSGCRDKLKLITHNTQSGFEILDDACFNFVVHHIFFSIIYMQCIWHINQSCIKLKKM